jgi:hypothetical protein
MCFIHLYIASSSERIPIIEGCHRTFSKVRNFHLFYLRILHCYVILGPLRLRGEFHLTMHQLQRNQKLIAVIVSLVGSLKNFPIYRNK